MTSYVEVAVPLGIRKTFTYSVPPHLQQFVSVGARVLVPFLRRILTGFIVATSAVARDPGIRIRPIKELIDREPCIPPDLVPILMKVADYYFAPPGEILRAAMPAGAQPSGKWVVRLAQKAEPILLGGLRPPDVSGQRAEILETLSHEGPQSIRQLSKLFPAKRFTEHLASLALQGWIRIDVKMERERVAPKEVLAIRLLDPTAAGLKPLTAKQRELLGALPADGARMMLKEAIARSGVTRAVATSLARRGAVEMVPMRLERQPVDLDEKYTPERHTLTEDQTKALTLLVEGLHAGAARRYLLHGVTGSGKTEVYWNLIREAMARGFTAMLLVPEIGLTPLLTRTAQSHFPDKTAVLHSAMSPGERLDQWQRIRDGKVSLVVGTRSAVFAPMPRLRLIIIDEEQESSYKQDETPCYHAREVAWWRMQPACGVLVLGSATPSIESFYEARTSGQTKYLLLSKRIRTRLLAQVEIIDMSLEFQRHGKRLVMSKQLETELERRLAQGQQSMILLNRRGYARTLLCRSCGHTFGCDECSIPMTYHQSDDRLICHYCGRQAPVPARCANCNGEYMYYLGVGTEQLDELVRSRFPTARVARMDRDTTRRRGALRTLLMDFSEGRIDILLGTQMLAKGHDFPNVTLVGVIAADAGLAFPDFRSAERTFQLLTQVAGRSGRGEIPGKVILQSLYPEHYALKYAGRQDYHAFFNHEIEYRKLLGYPPYARLIQILISDASSVKAFQTGEKIVRAIKSAATRDGLDRDVRILGPAVAPIEKLRGMYRYQVLLKFPPECELMPSLAKAFEKLSEDKVRLNAVKVDVDPLSLL